MYPKHAYEREPLNRRERQWEPVPLQLPLHQPSYWPEPPADEAEEEDQDNTSHGVLIIDMNDYTEIKL